MSLKVIKVFINNVVINDFTVVSVFCLTIGERGIRTLGMGLPYDALAMRYLRPLGHLSILYEALKKFYRKTNKKAMCYQILKKIWKYKMKKLWI